MTTIRYPFADDYSALEDTWEAPDALGVTAAERVAEHLNRIAEPGVSMLFPLQGSLPSAMAGWIMMGLIALEFVALVALAFTGTYRL
jgi:hypothetical protein